MYVARELKMSLEAAMELTTLELTLWAAFFGLERKEQEKRARQHGRKHSR